MVSTADPGKNETASILVIEDDPVIQRLLQRALSIKGFQVRLAGNGREGLDALAQHQDIRMVFLDLMMPVMDGFEFLEHYRAQESRLPVVVLSAAGARANQAPADFILHKPVPLNDLYQVADMFMSQDAGALTASRPERRREAVRGLDS